MTRSRRFVAVVMVAILTSGCSLLFVSGPPSRHASMDYFTCTEGNALPILDAVLAGLQVASALYLSSQDTAPTTDSVTIVSGAAWAAIYGVSAAIGFRRVKRCNDALVEWGQRQGHPSPIGPLPSAAYRP